MKGGGSILSGLQVYQAKEWVLRSWRDVFVDLVQGQLQFLFLSLLAGTLASFSPAVNLCLSAYPALRCQLLLLVRLLVMPTLVLPLADACPDSLQTDAIFAFVFFTPLRGVLFFSCPVS